MSAEQLTGFEDYIERNRLVSGKYARYHRLWAERWLAPGEHRTSNAQRPTSNVEVEEHTTHGSVQVRS